MSLLACFCRALYPSRPGSAPLLLLHPSSPAPTLSPEKPLHSTPFAAPTAFERHCLAKGEGYGHYQTLESWTATVERAGLSLVEHYYRPPGKEIEQQPWLATVSRRTA
eukprot:2069478-Rhodomonas_salina.1